MTLSRFPMSLSFLPYIRPFSSCLLPFARYVVKSACPVGIPVQQQHLSRSQSAFTRLPRLAHTPILWNDVAPAWPRPRSSLSSAVTLSANLSRECVTSGALAAWHVRTSASSAACIKGRFDLLVAGV
ncbi:hypothetical protein RJ55_08176 [Drechmeria coniospora]|nr:hypothetical protein RJ55_08176 [Drechmeria coniospora]